MSTSEATPKGAMLGPDDVIFILLRQKWKIIAFIVLGVVAAGVVWLVKQPLYGSRAKILVRYVSETRAMASGPNDSDIVRDPGIGGASVLNSEVEILMSRDSALETARVIGAAKILAAHGGGSNEQQAAGVLVANMKPEVGRNSGVITIRLEHPDPLIAREALQAFIQEYRRRHVEVHRAIGGYELLQSQTDQLRARLAQTEEQLRTEKNKAGIISLDQSKVDVGTRLATLKTELYAAEVDLAEKRAQLGQMEKSHPVPVPTATSVAAESDAPNDILTVESVDSQVVMAFESLSRKLTTLRERQTELLLQGHKDSGKLVQQIRHQLQETEKALVDLGFNPSSIKIIPNAGTGVGAVDALRGSPSLNIEIDRARVFALEARITLLKQQIKEERDQAKLLDSVEDAIVQLQRRKEVDEKKLLYYEANLDKARFDQTIDASKITNISVLEEPTPAFRDMLKLYKMMAMAFGGAFAAGLALAFATEMFLDGTLKRAKEIEQKTEIPLFVSIPNFSSIGRSRLKKLNRNRGGLALATHDDDLLTGEIAPWEANDPMLPYYEALRDRVVMSYTGDAHKPKIVGITSCNRGAGSTRIASGLAAALSRDVERNVLFIGLEKNSVSFTAFSRGRPHPETSSSTQEAETVIPEEREALLRQDFHALATTGRGPAGAGIVQSFCDLMPKLQVSNYDYIIFDLPPISETSGSLRLASQMERTLLVIEAEKTLKSKIDHTRRLLSGSNTRLYGVFNKSKSYGSKFMNSDA